MKPIIILLLMASVAAACPPGEHPITNMHTGKHECIKDKPPICEGVKVYEFTSTRNATCWQCNKYICEGNGYTGEECYDSCSFDNSRYEQLRKMWGK